MIAEQFVASQQEYLLAIEVLLKSSNLGPIESSRYIRSYSVLHIGIVSIELKLQLYCTFERLNFGAPGKLHLPLRVCTGDRVAQDKYQSHLWVVCSYSFSAWFPE